MSADPKVRQRPGPGHGKPIFRNSNMPLDKSIEHGKDWRRPYWGSAAIDSSCRPGGGCKYCSKGRGFSLIKASLRASIRHQEEDLIDMGILSQKSGISGCSENCFASQNT